MFGSAGDAARVAEEVGHEGRERDERQREPPPADERRAERQD
jgi:hypothetical protein